MLPRLLLQCRPRVLLQHGCEPEDVPQRRSQVMRYRIGERFQLFVSRFQQCGPLLQIQVEFADLFLGAAPLRNFPHQVAIRLRELRYALGHTLFQFQGHDHDFVVRRGQLGLQQSD